MAYDERNFMNLYIIFGHFLKQMRSNWRLLILIYTPLTILLIGIGVITQINPNISVLDFVRDVAALGDLPFYSGAVSQFGLLLWSASTTISTFTYLVVKKFFPARIESLKFLLFTSFITGYLLIDDTYMVHEDIIPSLLNEGSDIIGKALIGILVIFFLYSNRREILRNDFSLLFLALAFLGISVAVDIIPERFYEHAYFLANLIEDGAKLFGIATWLAFNYRYSFEQFSTLAFKDPD